MMAKTTAERVAKHRANKRADDFSQQWLDGIDPTTPEAFIDGKKFEVGASIQAEVTGFDGSLTNAFYDALKEYDCEEGKYLVVDLMEAWGMAEKI